MRVFLSLIIGSLFISCRDPQATNIYIFNNTTNHTIDITLYSLPRLQESIKIEKNSADNTIFTTGLGSAKSIEYAYDSVLVIYDDTVIITQYANVGEYKSNVENQILNSYNWTFIPSSEDLKKEYKSEAIYTFTEQDYLNAL